MKRNKFEDIIYDASQEVGYLFDCRRRLPVPLPRASRGGKMRKQRRQRAKLVRLMVASTKVQASFYEWPNRPV